MKRLLLASLLALPMFGQATLTLAVPSEANTSIAFSSEMVSSVQAQIKVVGGVNLPNTSSTLTQATLVGDTTFNVASTAGLKAGMGALIGTEVALITAVPSSTTITVVRGRVGTSAIASSIGATVTWLRSGSYGALVKSILQDWAAQNLVNYPGPTITSATSAVATQQATITTTVAGAVQ